MTTQVERIPDKLYEEMDLWYGALVQAFCDVSCPSSPEEPFSEDEAFLYRWKHDIKIGMGVSCITLKCEYCREDKACSQT